MAKSARGPGKRGETHYNRKNAGKNFQQGGDRKHRPGARDGETGSFGKGGSGRKPTFRRDEAGDKPFRPRREGQSGPKPFRRSDDDSRRPSGEKREFRPKADKEFGKRERDKEQRPFRDKKNFSRQEERPFKRRDDEGAGERKRESFEKSPRERKPMPRRTEGSEKKPFSRKREEEGFNAKRKPARRGDDRPSHKRDARAATPKRRTKFEREEFAEHSNPGKPGKWNTEAKTGPMTLNKYLAHAGVSSRRDAAAIIKEGKVKVNGTTLTEPGYRVQPNDKVTMDGKLMKPQKHFVYVLLNKPKDFITTTEDDRGRHTVMELVSGATEDRLYPVGRLDRNTTGVLLMTNDGDLAQHLSHPKYECKKIYQVSLDKDLTKRDFDKILEGVELEDGLASVDRLAFLDKKNEIGLEIHSGRNRIVRRIFEHLGYEVEKLDRVMYAGLTKKNVSRGKWRFLTEREVIQLKHFRT